MVTFAIVACAVLGAAVMLLWNWIMPPLFGLRPLGFLQAAGLLILCRILFRGFSGPRHQGNRWRHRMIERWEQMTPEERDAMRASLRSGAEI
jgi:hypothetical protein